MKQFRVAMLGYGIAGKAFARILNQTHDDILAKTGFDVKVVAITTGSRGSLYSMEGLDLVEATRQLEEEGKFNPEYPHYSTMNSMEVVETVDYDVVLELTPLNIETGLPAAKDPDSDPFDCPGNIAPHGQAPASNPAAGGWERIHISCLPHHAEAE